MLFFTKSQFSTKVWKIGKKLSQNPPQIHPKSTPYCKNSQTIISKSHLERKCEKRRVQERTKSKKWRPRAKKWGPRETNQSSTGYANPSWEELTLRLRRLVLVVVGIVIDVVVDVVRFLQYTSHLFRHSWCWRRTWSCELGFWNRWRHESCPLSWSLWRSVRVPERMFSATSL